MVVVCNAWCEDVLCLLLLQLRVPKMLLLAGTDRLDKALTIGQMQVQAEPSFMHILQLFDHHPHHKLQFFDLHGFGVTCIQSSAKSCVSCS